MLFNASYNHFQVLTGMMPLLLRPLDQWMLNSCAVASRSVIQLVLWWTMQVALLLQRTFSYARPWTLRSFIHYVPYVTIQDSWLENLIFRVSKFILFRMNQIKIIILPFSFSQNEYQNFLYYSVICEWLATKISAALERATLTALFKKKIIVKFQLKW